MPDVTFGGVPFTEAGEYFRQKIRLPTKAWTDIREGMHARAFVVAGATKDDLLADFQAAIQKGIDEGTGLAQFRKDFDQIVAKHGWAYKGTRNWRSKVIFQTNLTMARAAGRWAQIQDVKKTRPWLRYVAVLDKRTRPDHRRWNGTVLPVDDDWWNTHFPPNGWNCRCTVQSLSTAALADFGYEPSPAPPREDLVRRKDPFEGGTLALDRGIDPGFNYNVGKAHVGIAREIPDGYAKTQDAWKPLQGGAYRVFTPADYADSQVLEPRPMPQLGPPAAGQAEMIDLVKAAIGGDQVTLATPDGVGVSIDAEILGDHVQPRRAIWLPVLKELVEDPQEVWLIFERNETTGQVALRRRHIAIYDTPQRDQRMLLVFQSYKGQFEAWTMVPVDRAGYLERQRAGLRLWPPGNPAA